MAAIRHPKAKTAAPKRAKPSKAKKAGDEVALLRAQMDAVVNDYQETIRLTKLWFEAVERSPPKLKKGEKPLWQKIVELGESIPPEELARFPKDGARNLDHYIYGTPKADDA